MVSWAQKAPSEEITPTAKDVFAVPPRMEGTGELLGGEASGSVGGGRGASFAGRIGRGGGALDTEGAAWAGLDGAGTGRSVRVTSIVSPAAP